MHLTGNERGPGNVSPIYGRRALRHQATNLAKTPASVAREGKEILLVDPDPDELRAVQAALRLVADVEVCSDFRAARSRVLAHPPDLLVTNLRLEAYNGLHLVHLTAGTHTRCIVYATREDMVLAREVQAAGAFYERPTRLPHALPCYLNAALPRHDRRNLTMVDRRQNFRGGRRGIDLSAGAQAAVRIV
jgi:DNA-binding NtrC family response regulator